MIKKLLPFCTVIMLASLASTGCSGKKTYSMSFILDANAVSKLKKGQTLTLEYLTDQSVDAASSSFYLSKQQGEFILVPKNFSDAVSGVEVIEIKNSFGNILYNREGINTLNLRLGGQSVDGKFSYHIAFFRP